MSAAPLPAREAYRLWSATYRGETAVSALERRAVARLGLPVAGRALLDVGCGTGRRLREAADGAARAVGVDLVREMLAAGRSGADPGPPLAAGDVLALPLRSGSFDVLWCRLVLGHVRELGTAYAELGRVARPGARLVVTDFHPAAAAAGHVRSFRDAGGRLLAVAHHAHAVDDHRNAAEAAGWSLDTVHHVAPGPEERPFWEEAGRLEDFERQRDLPLVLALCLGR